MRMEGSSFDGDVWQANVHTMERDDGAVLDRRDEVVPTCRLRGSVC